MKLYRTLIEEQETNSDEKNYYRDNENYEKLKMYLYSILNDFDKYNFSAKVTRLETISIMHSIIEKIHPEPVSEFDINNIYTDMDTIPEPSLEMVKYLVSKGILIGKNSNILDLNSTCSRQELMAFVKRTYEFMLYETNKDSKAVFWKVSNGNNSVYLLGSIHVGSSSMYPLSKAIMNAFDKSDILVIEAHPDNQNEGIHYMQEKGKYIDYQSLEKLLSKNQKKHIITFAIIYHH